MVYQLHRGKQIHIFIRMSKNCMVSVSIYLANRIVFVVTRHVPKADASINRAVHAVVVQTPIWLGLPPHKVSNWTKGVHPEPVTLPAPVRATKPPGLPSILPLDGETRHLEEVPAPRCGSRSTWRSPPLGS